MQAGRGSPVYNGGNFSPVMDQPTHQFHKWVANSLLKKCKLFTVLSLNK